MRRNLEEAALAKMQEFPNQVHIVRRKDFNDYRKVHLLDQHGDELSLVDIIPDKGEAGYDPGVHVYAKAENHPGLSEDSDNYYILDGSIHCDLSFNAQKRLLESIQSAHPGTSSH